MEYRMRTSRDNEDHDGGQGSHKSGKRWDHDNGECESTSLIIKAQSCSYDQQFTIEHLYACRSILSQVLELRDRIRDQMITVKCMHEVMQNQQKALCSSSRQGLINDCVEHEKDSSFYLHKTREFQFKSETLISKIWNVVQTYEASLSGSPYSDKEIFNVQIEEADLEDSDLEHPETEPKSKIKGSKRIDKPFDTIEGHNTSEFHEKRAEFWECLAKCSINVLNSMYDGEHLRNQTTGHLDGKDTVTIRREDLNMFSNQIGDLSDDVRRLKEQSQDDGCQIQKLKEQNDRFHKALCARKEKILRLEDFLAKEKARNERASFTDESKELQAVIAQLRLSIETHRDRYLKATAEKDALKGHNEELMERVRRREDALKKAQDRCRKLESKMSGKKSTSVGCRKDFHTLNPSESVIQPSVCQDASAASKAHCKSQLEQAAIERSANDARPEEFYQSNIPEMMPQEQEFSSIEDESDVISARYPVHSQQTECDSVVSSEPKLVPDSHNDEEESDVHGEDQERYFDTLKSKEHQVIAPSVHTDPNHEDRKALSKDGPDMDTIRSALAKADDTILSCMQRIENLNKSLAISQDEASKSQQMYASNLEELDTARRSLHASQSLILQLQKQLSDVQEASAAYHHQMDQMIMSEREDFAKESHLLSSQVQDLSSKLVCSQAKFLHQIQAGRKELEKAQAINRQLSTQIAQKENVIQTYAMALGERKINSPASESTETICP